MGVRSQLIGTQGSTPALGFFYLLKSFIDPAQPPQFPTDPGKALTNPYVDGVLIRETWDCIYNHDHTGSPDFSWLTARINETLVAGKLVGIEILAGNFAPTSFYTAFPDETVDLSHGGPSTCVWGPNFISLWTTFNEQLAALSTISGPLDGVARYVKLIGVGATSESFFIHQSNPGMSADLAAANASATTLGYVDSGDGQGSGANAWRINAPKLVDMYSSVWTRTPFMLGTGPPWPNTVLYTGDEMLQTLVNYGINTYRGRFGVRNDSLDHTPDAGPGPLLVAQAAASCIASGFQYQISMEPTIPAGGGGADPTPPLWMDLSLGIGISAKAHLIECFAGDLDSGTNPDEWGPQLGVVLANRRTTMVGIPY